MAIFSYIHKLVNKFLMLLLGTLVESLVIVSENWLTSFWRRCWGLQLVFGSRVENFGQQVFGAIVGDWRDSLSLIKNLLRP